MEYQIFYMAVTAGQSPDRMNNVGQFSFLSPNAESDMDRSCD